MRSIDLLHCDSLISKTILIPCVIPGNLIRITNKFPSGPSTGVDRKPLEPRDENAMKFFFNLKCAGEKRYQDRQQEFVFICIFIRLKLLASVA